MVQLPESVARSGNALKAQTEAQLARATSEVQKEYLRTASLPDNIHGICEDYRAGASIDVKHDEADMNKRIACPVLALWSDRGPIGRLFDVLAIWKARGTTVTGRGLPEAITCRKTSPIR